MASASMYVFHASFCVLWCSTCVSKSLLFISNKRIKLFIRFKNLVLKLIKKTKPQNEQTKKTRKPLPCSKGINHIYESRKWVAVCQIIFSNMFFVEGDLQTIGIQWLLEFYSNVQDLAEYKEFLETDYAFFFIGVMFVVFVCPWLMPQ